MRRKFVGFLALPLVAGCTVGPEYRKPPVAMSDRWLEPASTAPVDLGWWQSFGDPQLNRLVTLAITSNPDLREARARIAEARSNREAAAGGALPQVDAKASATQNRISKNGQLPIASIPGFKRDFSLYDIGFDASWELDLWGRNRREVEAASARNQASEWSQRDVLVGLIAEVARNYVELRVAQGVLSATLDQAHSNRDLTRLSDLRFRSGEDTRIAAEEARSQAAGSAQAADLAKAKVSTSAYRLAALVGLPPERLVPELSDVVGPIPMPPRSIAMGIRSDLLSRRPDVRRAERELAAATADIGVAKADLYPRFSLIGSLGQQARSPGDLLSSGSTRFGIGPSFSWPIFSAGRIRAQIRGSGARADAAAARYEKAILSALSDSESAANRLARYSAAADEARDAEASERAAFGLVQLRFSRGEDDRLTMERARLKWLEVRSRMDEANGDYAVAAIALFKALGGGWEARSSPTDDSGH
ncbi:MAG: efflux transporter outer membrane subunit [Nitrobacter sp.]